MNAFTRAARQARLWVLLALCIVFAPLARAQSDYPNRPIQMILPWSTGGSSSNLMLYLGQKMAEDLGQPVVLENRPGANSVIGTNLLAKSAPDGYTMMLTTSGHVMLPYTTPNLPFDVIKDFTPVATLTNTQYALVVNPKIPARTLREFIDLAKARPTEFFYGESGGSSHLAAEQFNLMTGTRLQRVPYANKGAAAVLNDLVGGQIHAFFAPGVAPYVTAGRLRALAISGDGRSPALPDVPTFTEAGLPNFEVKVWYGILAPSGTPKPIVDRVSGSLARILTMPEVKSALLQMDLDTFISTPEAFQSLMRADKARYEKIITDAKITFGS